MTRELCVQVRENLNGGDNTRCGDLRSPHPPAPLETVWTTNPDGLESHKGYSDEFFVSRFSLTPPDHPVPVVEPLEIPLTIETGKVRSISFWQKRAGSDATRGGNRYSSDHLQWQELGEGKAKIVRQEGDQVIVQITPVELGEETVCIGVSFDDGGYEERYFHLRTLPSDKGLKRIDLRFVDESSYPPGPLRLIAMLTYDNLAFDIPALSLEDFQLTVDQPAPPIVRIDLDGRIHTLREGEFKVRARVGSMEGSIGLGLRAKAPRPNP